MTRARFTTAYLLLPSFRHLLLIAVRNSNVHHHLSCLVQFRGGLTGNGMLKMVGEEVGQLCESW